MRFVSYNEYSYFSNEIFCWNWISRKMLHSFSVLISTIQMRFSAAHSLCSQKLFFYYSSSFLSRFMLRQFPNFQMNDVHVPFLCILYLTRSRSRTIKMLVNNSMIRFCNTMQIWFTWQKAKKSICFVAAV